MSEPTERERLRTAEEALSLAMLRLGGEAPSTVYDERGYAIWVASVAADITEPFRTALRAAEEKADSWKEAAEYEQHHARRFQSESNADRIALATAESSLAGRLARKHDPAVVRAAGALVELWEAMQDVRITHPGYMPGSEPSAADNCGAILDMLDHGIRNIAAYLQVTL